MLLMILFILSSTKSGEFWFDPLWGVLTTVAQSVLGKSFVAILAFFLIVVPLVLLQAF